MAVRGVAFAVLACLLEVGPAPPEQFGLRPFPGRPEQRLAPIIDAMKQDRQQQAVIDVGEIP